MSDHQWLSSLLLSVAAYAEANGLPEVSKKASEAAMVALDEVPRLPLTQALARLVAGEHDDF